MTTIKHIWRATIRVYGMRAHGILYLKINSKEPDAKSPGYTIDDSTLRILKDGGAKAGPVIPLEEHENHIPLFGRVIVYDNDKVLAENDDFDDYLKKISAKP